jgi:hypothetical protein
MLSQIKLEILRRKCDRKSKKEGEREIFKEKGKTANEKGENINLKGL